MSESSLSAFEAVVAPKCPAKAVSLPATAKGAPDKFSPDSQQLWVLVCCWVAFVCD